MLVLFNHFNHIIVFHSVLFSNVTKKMYTLAVILSDGADKIRTHLERQEKKRKKTEVRAGPKGMLLF